MQNLNAQISLIQDNDIETLTRLYEVDFPKAPSPEDLDYLYGWNIKNIIQHIIKKSENNSYTYLIFTHTSGKDITGFAILKLHNKDNLNEKKEYLYTTNQPLNKIYNYALIDYLYVKEEYRKQHIAEQLITASLLYCKDCNILTVDLLVKNYNTPAIKLYSKLGFKQMDPQKKQLFIPHELTCQKIQNGEMLLFEKQVISETTPQP